MSVANKLMLGGEVVAELIEGPKGDEGKSAYQLAVESGYSGTQAQWLASLKGEKGATGATGATGTAAEIFHVRPVGVWYTHPKGATVWDDGRLWLNVSEMESGFPSHSRASRNIGCFSFHGMQAGYKLDPADFGGDLHITWPAWSSTVNRSKSFVLSGVPTLHEGLNYLPTVREYLGSASGFNDTAARYGRTVLNRYVRVALTSVGKAGMQLRALLTPSGWTGTPPGGTLADWPAWKNYVAHALPGTTGYTTEDSARFAVVDIPQTVNGAPVSADNPLFLTFTFSHESYRSSIEKLRGIAFVLVDSSPTAASTITIESSNNSEPKFLETLKTGDSAGTENVVIPTTIPWVNETHKRPQVCDVLVPSWIPLGEC